MATPSKLKIGNLYTFKSTKFTKEKPHILMFVEKITLHITTEPTYRFMFLDLNTAQIVRCAPYKISLMITVDNK